MLLHRCEEGKLPFPLKTGSSELFFLHHQHLREGFDDLVNKVLSFSELQSTESLSLRSSALPRALAGGRGLKSIKRQPSGINQWESERAAVPGGGRKEGRRDQRGRSEACQRADEREKENLCLMSSAHAADWSEYCLVTSDTDVTQLN